MRQHRSGVFSPFHEPGRGVSGWPRLFFAAAALTVSTLAVSPLAVSTLAASPLAASSPTISNLTASSPTASRLPADAAPAATSETRPFTVTVRLPDGRPVAGARVFADSVLGEGRSVAVADAAGNAAFPGLPPGRYLLSAAAAAGTAAPVEIEVEIESGPAAPLAGPAPLTLRFAAHRESVVVSAALGARAGREAGPLVDTLTAEELRERGERDLVGALRGVAGILVRQDGGPGHLAQVQVRGLPGSATAVVVDGAPLRDAASITGGSAALLPGVGLLGVDRLEIRRGGGSTLYGTNGMGGVLQIVTRGGSGGDSLRASAEFGSAGRAAGAAEWGAGGPRGAVFASLGERRVREGTDGDDPFENTTASFRAGRRLSPGLRLSARASWSNAEVGLNENPVPVGGPATGVVEAAAVAPETVRAYEGGAALADLDFGAATLLPAANDPDASQRTRFLSALVSLAGNPTPSLAWTVRYHDLATRRENTDGPGGVNPWDPAAPQTISYAAGIRTGSARVEFGGGPHRLLVGAEAEWERARTVDPAFSTRLRQSGLAAVVQKELRTAEGRASLRAAVRFHRFETRAPELEPEEGSPYAGALPPPGATAVTADFSGTAALGGGLLLRGSWGRGFRAPSLYERFGTWYSTFGYSIFGDPRLEPEFTSAADLGLDWESAAGGVRFRAAAFRSRRPQIIAFGSFDAASDPFGRFGGYENTAARGARGWETDLALAPGGRTRARLQYTFTDADAPENGPAELPAAWLLPRHQGAALASGRVGDRFGWAADLHLSSSMHAPLYDPDSFSTRVFRFAGLRRLDLAASLEVVRGLTLRFVVEDALDDAAFQSGGFRPPGRVFRANLEWSGR